MDAIFTEYVVSATTSTRVTEYSLHVWALSIFAAIAAVVIANVICSAYSAPSLDHIPAVGPTGWLTSALGAYAFFKNPHAIIQDGLREYGPQLFRIRTMDRWSVIVSDPKLIEDIRIAGDDELSYAAAVNDILQVKYAIGPEIANDHHHAEVVRSILTKNLSAIFPDLCDEIVHAFENAIPSKDNGWTAVPVLHCAMKVVCQSSGRIFIGLPLCRDPSYSDLIIHHTARSFTVGPLVNIFPRFLHPLVGPLVSVSRGSISRANQLLGKTINQRMREDNELGVDRAGRPNDLISWLIDAAPQSEKQSHLYLKRFLVVNGSAIHTTSNSFSQVLLSLAARPEYLQPLREEVERVIDERGWTKAAIDSMHKLDSFIREVLRMTGINTLSVVRRVVKASGFTFSNGVHIPHGTTMFVSARAVHHCEEDYPNPKEFNGFRFSDLREGASDEGGMAFRHQLVSTASGHVTFGQGRHACAGRFFAAVQLKAMLAHVLLNYDFKMEDEQMPIGQWRGTFWMANPLIKVLFRKRR